MKMTINFGRLLHIACRVTGSTPKDVFSRSRKSDAVTARIIFFAIATEEGCEMEDITRYFHRDRTTGYHWKNNINDLFRFDREFRDKIHNAKYYWYGKNESI